MPNGIRERAKIYAINWRCNESDERSDVEMMADFTKLETQKLQDENKRLQEALADAIRSPMGVCPESAQGLVTDDDIQHAEIRRNALNG